MLFKNLLLFSVILNDLILNGESQCTHGSIRLVGGSGNYEGNVQVCVNGTWGYVCDTGWTSTDATVVCSQLGYSTTSVLLQRLSYYGLGSDIIWLYSVTCTGTETNLLDCSHDYGTCEFDHMAGVFCPFGTGGSGCTNGDIRLVSFKSQIYGRSEGRVEFCTSHTWGRVCNKGWSSNEATVACRQLGYYGYINYFTNSYYGPGSGSLSLTNLNCNGEESRLFSCSAQQGKYYCSSYNEAGVRCYSRNETTCQNGSVMVWNAYTASTTEGIVLFCKNSSWFPLHHSSNCIAAKIACKSIGHSSVAYIRMNAGKYYGYYYNIHYGYLCTSSNRSLLECSETSYGYRYQYSLGVKCETSISTLNSNCSNGDVRLNGSTKENEGMIEYCYDNSWARLCSLSEHTATLICKMLGYRDWSSIFSDDMSGRADAKSEFQYLSCSSSADKLLQCSIITSCGPAACQRQYGLQCYNSCSHGSVRLIGGSGNYEGNVQVCVNGTWGYVCDNSWDTSDVKVVCSQLGYSASSFVSAKSAFYGYREGRKWIDQIFCNGLESKLLDCPFKININSTACTDNEIAGAFCSGSGNCTSGDIRLVSSLSGSYGRSEGRVEVCYNNTWGTVCDDGWSSKDATVACRQLGYSNYITNQYGTYGYGSRSIWLSELSCEGGESNLFSCPANPVGSHHCYHHEDVGVKCFSRDFSSCSDGSLKLWSAFDSTPDNEGLLLICKDSVWHPMHKSSDCQIADLLCSAKGYSAVEYIKSDAGKHYGYYYYPHYSYNFCSTSLDECYGSNYGYQYDSSLGIKCRALNSVTSSSCTNGKFRLSNGNNDNQGRVEYCYKGEWTAMCSLMMHTARMICENLGYIEWRVIGDERFGRLDATSKFQSLSCFSSDHDLSDCSIQTSCTPTNCSTQYGIICKNICFHGDVRLVGGSGDYEGNVQVCMNGTWGYVCDNSWDANDAKVVCSQLGYSTSTVAYRLSSYYGYSDGTIWLDNVHCSGTEKNLTDCSHGVINIALGVCDQRKLAGVFCPFGGSYCKEGEIRLSNFFSNIYGRSEGRVEVCYNNVWGTVCDDGWDSYDALVACRQLGYYYYNKYYTNAHYGAGSGLIWLSNLYCKGGEKKLLFCSTNVIGSNRCGHGEDAGVQCQSRDFTSCSYGDIKLWSFYSSTPANEGMVLVCKYGNWYPMHVSSNLKAAEIACTSIGYLSVEFTISNAGKHYGYYHYDHYQYTCSSCGSSLTGCTQTFKGYHYYYSLGVKCKKKQSICTDGGVQLTEGNEGRIDYCHNGEWVPMCSVSAHVAKLVCEQYGSKKWRIVTDEQYGRVDTVSKFQSLSCSSSSTNLSDCSVVTSCGNTNCSIQYGLRCRNDCTHGEVNLVGGSYDYEGNVQVCINGSWSYICQNGWDVNDSLVVCSQFGYSTSNVLQKSGVYFGYGDGTFWLTNVSCTGTEVKLIDCPHEIEAAICDSTDVVGLICSGDGSICLSGSIRLANFHSNSYGRSEGRVEVCHNNEWGTVCDDGWSSNDATVACKQLGYYNYISYSTYYGAGSGSIWLSYLSCSGGESSLFSCAANPIGSHHCTHSEDVGIKCYSRDLTSCPDGTVKLWSAYATTPDNEGILLTCMSGTWYPLYHTTDCKVAELACESLGYEGMEYMRSNAGKYYGYYYYTNYFYSCSSTAKSLLECSTSNYGYRYTNSLGVKCKSSSQFLSCTEGSVRLTGSKTRNEGRAEYCYRNVWTPMCSLSSATAKIICDSFGFNEWSIVNDERFGRLGSTSRFQYFSCSRSNTNISECSLITSSCSSSSCSVQYGLVCSILCIQGNVRLVGGSGDYEGNVQMCINGTWGYVCDNKWGTNDAKVVCSQLGYSKSNAIYRLSSYYGYGSGSIWLDKVECSGSEIQLIECPHREYTVCDHKDLAGVFCLTIGPGCNSGDIRLANFYSNAYGRSEGRVEVCYANEWGTVCDNGWSSGDADVACKQLGFYSYINYYSSAYYGSGIGSIWLSYLSCSGGESSLFSCSASPIGNHHCSHYGDAGVQCYSRDVSACSHGSVKLWSAFSSTPSNEGIVLICKAGTWYPVLDSSNCRAAEIACNATGTNELKFIRHNAGKYYGYYYSTHYYYSCSNHDNDLLECAETGYNNQNYYNSLGVTCKPTNMSHSSAIFRASNCASGDVHLRNGSSNSEGRVEYCFNGEWAPMCSMSIFTAKLICKRLGFMENTNVVVEMFDILDYVASKFQTLSCSSSYADLTQCPVTTTCFPTTCKHQYGLKCNETCDNGDVRLVGGSGDYEGNVQVCVNGTWGYVCDNSWNTNDAKVVCSQLGYSTSNVVYRDTSYYGFGDGQIWLDKLHCSGSEAKLLDCSHGVGIGATVCSYEEMAGVACLSGGSNCNSGDIRLVNSYSNSYGRSEGRVEVCYNNKWGTVCDDGWNSKDATVACEQLGYYNYITYYSSAYYGAGLGSIWLSYLNCQGGETSLFSCPANQIGVHHCYHYEDAGVKCYSQDDSSCSEGDVKLWSAYKHTPSDEGIVLFCSGGMWYPVHYTSDCKVAKLACKAAGFSHVQYIRSNAGKYYGYYYKSHYYHSCANSNQHLWECSTQNFGTQYYNSLGLKCEIPAPTSNCTSGAVRLTNGKVPTEGRVEYCYGGDWIAMCKLSLPTARLICQELGHTEWSLIISDERFGRLNMKSIFQSLSCSSTYTDLSQCSVSTTCTLNVCSTEYSLRCFSSGNECKDGAIRLVDGNIEQEGRPEVCVNGIWGSICHNGWTSNGAYATCLTLGYKGKSSPTIYFNSHFGSGNGPILWSDVSCKFWNDNVFDCSRTSYPFFTCTSDQVSGVTCTEGCSNADVRLVGGGFENEGTVEVCFNNLWGLISDVGWTDADAKVVCNQLGHREGIAKALQNSVYGDESDLSECTNTELSLSAGKHLLLSTDVAGVDCIYDPPTPPPCIVNPDVDPNNSCSTEGSIKLIKDGFESTSEGGVLYCNGNFWTPLCTMDSRAAAVACRQLGHTQYKWGSTFSGAYEEFGTLLNYSLVQNVTCSGSETDFSKCITHNPVDGCLPWCPNKIGLRCFDPGVCKEGSLRLVDGVIEQEGRVEVCINEVWGSMCDEGWDKTDGHVACQQLGHPELEPVVFNNSHFGNGQYPIVYSNIKCGGWENKLDDCEKDQHLNFECSAHSTAGLLCGYDCNDGDIQLSGGESDIEGTVEVCYDNIWGLISEEGWTSKDAHVVCRQLGYTVEGTVAKGSSFYSKPNKTVHLSNVQCIGDEKRLDECTRTRYSLKTGKSELESVNVAGVRCYASPTAIPTEPEQSSKFAFTLLSSSSSSTLLASNPSILIKSTSTYTKPLIITSIFAKDGLSFTPNGMSSRTISSSVSTSTNATTKINISTMVPRETSKGSISSNLSSQVTGAVLVTLVVIMGLVIILLVILLILSIVKRRTIKSSLKQKGTDEFELSDHSFGHIRAKLEETEQCGYVKEAVEVQDMEKVSIDDNYEKIFN